MQQADSLRYEVAAHAAHQPQPGGHVLAQCHSQRAVAVGEHLGPVGDHQRGGVVRVQQQRRPRQPVVEDGAAVDERPRRVERRHAQDVDAAVRRSRGGRLRGQFVALHMPGLGRRRPLLPQAPAVVVGRAAVVHVAAADDRPLRLDVGQRAVVHARVLRHGGGDLLEDEAGGEGRLAQANALAQLGQNLPVGPRLAHRRDAGVVALDAPLAVSERALTLGPALGGQDHVGQFGRWRQEQFLDDEEGQPAAAVHQTIADGVGPGHEERAQAAIGRRGIDLVGVQAGAGRGAVAGRVGGVDAHVARALAVGVPADGHQAVVQPPGERLRLLAALQQQQVGQHPRQSVGLVIAQSLGPVEDDQVVGLHEGVGHRAGFIGRRVAGIDVGQGQQLAHGCRRCAVLVSADKTGVGVEACRPGVEHDQRRAALGGLLDAQPPHRRFLVQVGGDDEDGVAAPQVFQVAAAGQAHAGDHVRAGQPPLGQVDVAAAQPLTEETLELEVVLVAQPVASHAGDGVLVLLQPPGDEVEGVIP